MGQWSNLTANFLSRSCRLIILALAISTAVPFIFGINTAHAQTIPTAVWHPPAIIPPIGSEGTIRLVFNGVLNGPDVATSIRNFTSFDLSYTGIRQIDRLTSTGGTAFIPFTPTENDFTITLAANSVILNGVRGPANAVTFTYIRTTAPPTISLRGPFAGDAQRITRIREIDFIVADDFNSDRQPVEDFWEISINGGMDYGHTTGRPPALPTVTFTLPEGRYDDDQVRVRQSIDQVLSPFAGLDAFIFDFMPPVITLKGAARIVLEVGDTYTDLGATVTDNLDTDIQSKLIVDSSAVDTSTASTYTVMYSATDHTEHGSNTGRATREVVVQDQLAFAVGGEPVLTSNGATVGSVTYAKAGDILTLAFTTNLPLANTPTVTIVGAARAATVTKGAGNAYSAAYTVVAAHFQGSDGVAARYDIGAMAAADDAGNTLDPPVAASAILIDVVAPVVTFPEIVGRGVVDVEQSHIITFSEAVTATVASFSSSTGLMVNGVSGSGSRTLTVAYTPDLESFVLAIDGRGITDRAGNRAPSSRQSRAGFAVELPGISDLDGESGVSLDDAKFLYYAHALGSELDDPAVQTRVLGPLNTDADADDLLMLLTAARGSLSGDLNADGATDDEDAAVLYYSFALEGSLGDGSDTKPGIPEIKRAILGPLAGGAGDDTAINAMLQRVYQLRGQ